MSEPTVTVLLGVIFVDGTAAESEKQRLLTTLYRFSNPESYVRKLTHLMIKGIKENQGFEKFDESMDKISDKLDEIVGSYWD